MARRTTLLDFAIGAALAVVPVMLGILLLVAVIRPMEPSAVGPGRQPGDRYLSVRHVAALKTFEQAIVRRAGMPAEKATAAGVLAGVPSCRGDWGEDRASGWLASLRGHAAGPSQAERIAAQLSEL